MSDTERYNIKTLSFVIINELKDKLMSFLLHNFTVGWHNQMFKHCLLDFPFNYIMSAMDSAENYISSSKWGAEYALITVTNHFFDSVELVTSACDRLQATPFFFLNWRKQWLPQPITHQYITTCLPAFLLLRWCHQNSWSFTCFERFECIFSKSNYPQAEHMEQTLQK